jgi:dimethylamine/trimethylamine dehydrogenase
VVTATARLPNDDLCRRLRSDSAALSAAGIKSVAAIGDSYSPATIAHAVYAGHRYARELGAAVDSDRPFGRELPLVSD